jgi:hypothetical protein
MHRLDELENLLIRAKFSIGIVLAFIKASAGLHHVTLFQLTKSKHVWERRNKMKVHPE